MLKLLFGLTVLSSMCLLTSATFSQSSPAQKPIDCGVKDNVEDSACQTTLKELFARQGNTLTLRLESGKSKKYVSNRAACSGENVDEAKCLVFVLLRYFPQTHSYLVEKGFTECGAYLLVSRHTGSETVMYAMPTFSPNTKYMLSIDQSDACDRKYDIAIWSMQVDPPKLEFKYQAKGYENWEVEAWENDTHIRMKAFINGIPPHEQQAELVRNETGWDLELGRRTELPK
jgi:hypothetical protein